MVEVTTREFTRRFPEFRARAARGDAIRVTAPEGVYVFTREPRGLTGAGLLQKLSALPPGKGFLDEGGAEVVAKSRRRAAIARSPWD